MNWSNTSSTDSTWSASSGLDDSWTALGVIGFLLMEDGGYLLQEDSTKIVIDPSKYSVYTNISSGGRSWTNVSSIDSIWN